MFSRATFVCLPLSSLFCGLQIVQVQVTSIMDSNFTNIDVVNGRGQGIQRLPGNVMFRKLVSAHKRTYAQAPKSHKVKVSQGIVTALRRFGSNFLEFDTKTGLYHDIGDEKAVSKTGQALREGQVKLKQELAAEKGESKSSSFITSTSSNISTSLEESYTNHSIQIMQSLRMEEQMVMVEDQSPPQSPRPSKQSSKSASQHEIYEDHDMSKSSNLQPTKSSSDTSQRAIHNDRSTSESELSVQLLNTTDEEVTDILEEMRFEFDFSEMDAGDIFSSTSMTLGANANENVAAV